MSTHEKGGSITPGLFIVSLDVRWLRVAVDRAGRPGFEIYFRLVNLESASLICYLSPKLLLC